MKAGRMTAPEEPLKRADFGMDIPKAGEEYQDDEYLVGVDFANLKLPLACFCVTNTA